jgi:hypothetical protein
MINEILSKIESSIPAETKQNFKRRLAIDIQTFIELSNNLKSMIQNYQELKDFLFKNNENAIHFSGDILVKTLHEYWIKGGNIEDIFIENAQATSFYADFECIW